MKTEYHKPCYSRDAYWVDESGRRWSLIWSRRGFASEFIHHLPALLAKTKNRRVVLYIRASAAWQKSNGNLDEAVQEALQQLEALGCTVVAVFTEKEATAVQLEQEIENFMDLAGRYSDPVVQDGYERKRQERSDAYTKLVATIDKDRELLRQADRDHESIEKWSDDLRALKGAIKGDSQRAIDSRVALRQHLSELITRIDVYARGFPRRATLLELDDSDPAMPPMPYTPPMSYKGRSIDEYSNLPEGERPAKIKLRREQDARRFGRPDTSADLENHISEILAEYGRSFPQKFLTGAVKYIMEQELSKRGRFYRVHFKTGAVVDIVPKGSIAMGVALRDKVSPKERSKYVDRSEWRYIWPPIGELVEEFDSKRGRDR
jgi:hypothetical protein